MNITQQDKGTSLVELLFAITLLSILSSLSALLIFNLLKTSTKLAENDSNHKKATKVFLEVDKLLSNSTSIPTLKNIWLDHSNFFDAGIDAETNSLTVTTYDKKTFGVVFDSSSKCGKGKCSLSICFFNKDSTGKLFSKDAHWIAMGVDGYKLSSLRPLSKLSSKSCNGEAWKVKSLEKKTKEVDVSDGDVLLHHTKYVLRVKNIYKISLTDRGSIIKSSLLSSDKQPLVDSVSKLSFRKAEAAPLELTTEIVFLDNEKRYALDLAIPQRTELSYYIIN